MPFWKQSEAYLTVSIVPDKVELASDCFHCTQTEAQTQTQTEVLRPHAWKDHFDF